MTQQLFIDGVLADISQNVSVALALKSNLLGDVSKILSNHTYTFNIPATARNRRLVGCSDTLAVQTAFPYQYHRADYYRDGVPIIQGGRLVLLSVGEDIECMVTWGVSSALSALVQSGASLKDIESDDTITYNEIPAYTLWGNFIADTNYNAFYARCDYHAPLEDEEQEKKAAQRGWNATTYIRPVVRVPWLLQKIQSQYNVSLVFGQEQQDVLQRLCIPLVEDSPSALTEDTSVMTLGTPSSSGAVDVYPFTMDNTGGIFSSYTNNIAYVGTTKTITLSFNIQMQTNVAWASALCAANHIQVRVYTGSDYEDPDDLQQTFTIIEMEGDNAVVQAKGEIDVALSSGQGISILVVAKNALWRVPVTISGKEVTAYNQSEHVQFGSQYPIASNLPDIKVVDFIKTICALLGVWCKQPSGNTLEFVPYDRVRDNKNYAIDWTGIVVPTYYDERPRNTEYRVDEWAQKNWLKYKDEEKYEGQADASIDVADETLEQERELFVLPFAASMVNRVGMANVPIWKLSNYEQLMVGEDTLPTYSIEKCEPRILMARPTRTSRYVGDSDPNNRAVQLSMDGMRFADVITAFYSALASFLNTARVVTERVRMTDVELLQFDETIPVYLGQYGCTFAVLEIKADSNGTAEVKLLKI